MSDHGRRLDGKVALVTGAGASRNVMGNGKATGILFSREGAQVVLVDRSEDRVKETQMAIQAEGGEATIFVGDVTSDADCKTMIDTAYQRYGRLDILHNNVGINGPGSVLEISEEEWDRVMRVNLSSMVLTSKHAIPRMVSGGGGAIVNISSISAVRPRGMTSYTVSKAGVVALTQAMAIDHAKDNIRVNCILPGPAYTSMVANGMTEKARELRRRASPLMIEGTSWDVAWAAVYLASDEARWVTGVALPVDGGVTLDSPRR